MKIRLSDEDRKKIEQAKEHLYKAQHILEEFCADKIECNCVINTKGKTGKGNCPYELAGFAYHAVLGILYNDAITEMRQKEAEKNNVQGV